MQNYEKIIEKKPFDACRMEIVSLHRADVITTSFESEEDIFGGFDLTGEPIEPNE